ncbi:MAG: DNA translocase FtsK [bacterium]|nr:DNA translocase FtsK [bacterium]
MSKTSAKKIQAKKSTSRKRRKDSGINAKILLSGIAILCYICAIAIAFSLFVSDGIFLNIKNTSYIYFGFGVFILPFILFCLGMFLMRFNFRLAKPHIIVGLPLVLFSLLGLLVPLAPDQTGIVGNRIWGELNTLIPGPLATVLMVAVMVIGLAVLFDTSLDVFFEKIFSVVGGFFSLILKRFMPSTHTLTTSSRSPTISIATVATTGTVTGLRDQFNPFKGKEKKKDEKDIKRKDISETHESMEEKEIFTTQPVVNSVGQASIWNYPPISLFSNVPGKPADRGDIKNNSSIIEKTLESFGIVAKVVEIDQGPAVTRYAIDLAQGTKIAKITSLQSDMAMALAAHTGEVRIEAPIPGKALVGIEIPNRTLEVVPIRSILASEHMKNMKSKIVVPLGFDAACNPLVADISKMPHLLVAGTTNSGKSVMLTNIIVSILFRASPDEVKLILVDPKRVEMAGFNNIPHLLTPVINDPDKTLSALKWAVSEMQRRYHIFSEVGARNIAAYNEMSGFQAVPYIVIVIDELADLMMYAPNEVEEAICRLAQMARAVGIHLIIATQRPSVDVLTGLIKANIPSRMAFNVSSMVDSRVILDTPGAEKLLGRGDMLYQGSEMAKPIRVQGPLIKEEEINSLMNFLKASGVSPAYTEEVVTQPVNVGRGTGASSGDVNDRDVMFDDAARTIIQFNNASASFLQRKMKFGYARAARLLDELEAAGIVGPSNGSKPREILKKEWPES